MKRSLSNWLSVYLDSYAGIILLSFTIFGIPLFPDPIQDLLYRIMTIIIFLGIIFLPGKNKRLIFGVVIAAILLKWLIGPVFKNVYLTNLSEVLNLLVFLYAVGWNSLEIARRRVVDQKTILDAINSYLLIGLAFGTLIAFVHQGDPSSFSFPADVPPGMTDYNYYSFVTLTTLGYGDIVPGTDSARSLAILIGVTGQMYVAIIVALLVGKYASKAD